MFKILSSGLTLFVLAIVFSISAYAQAGLVSYWPGDGNANDIVGGNHGVMVNGAGFRSGVFGQAFSFDGVDDLMQAPTAGLPTGNNARTLAMWVKVDQHVTIEDFFGGYGTFGAFTQTFHLGQNSGLFFSQWGTGVGGPSLQAGTWYHIAVTNVGNSVSLYVNGGLVNSGSVPINTPVGTQFFAGSIAGPEGSIRRLKGAIDDIAVFDRALSATEIQGLLNGIIRPASLPPTESRAYIANQGTNSVEIMDLATNALIGNVPVGRAPSHIAVNSTGTRVYVTNAENRDVSVIDAGSSTVIATIPVGDGPTGIAVTPDDSRVYVVNDRGNSVFVIDASTNQVVSSVSLFGNPEDIAITPDGSRAYVASINGNCVFVIDTASNALTATIPIPGIPPYSDALPSGVNITPDGSLAVVTDLRGSALTIINTSTNSIVTTLMLGGFNARSVDFSPDGHTAYVAVEGGGNLAIVDLTIFTVTAQVHVGTSPFSVAVSADGKRAYIADYNSPSFAIVDTVSKMVFAPLALSSGRAFVALWEVPQSDSTPPSIIPTVTGTLGNSSWYTTDVGVSWSIADDESAVASSTGCEAVSVTTDTGGVTFTCTATSAGGTGTQSVTIKRDATAPLVSCGSTDGSWHAADVSIACTANDGISGLATSGDSSFNLSTSVAPGTETSNAVTNNRQVCDVAGNCSTAGGISGNKVDKKAPVISITSPTAGNYFLNQAVTVAFTCTDGGSGIASCVGTSANGSSLNTASIGAKVFTVSATDNVGNSATPTNVNYTINFGVSVLFDQSKAAKSGSTIPIKIRFVDANGANVSSASTVAHAVSVIQTSSQATTTLDDAGDSNPDFDFRYDATLGGYIFNLKTTGYGTGSYILNFVSGNSPTVYSVGFQVRQ